MKTRRPDYSKEEIRVKVRKYCISVSLYHSHRLLIGGASLDIERGKDYTSCCVGRMCMNWSNNSQALSKLEKVALGCASEKGRPLVLIFNNVHYFRHTEEGSNMLLLLQQRAESWAESGKSIEGINVHLTYWLNKKKLGILTCVFSSLVFLVLCPKSNANVP